MRKKMTPRSFWRNPPEVRPAELPQIRSLLSWDGPRPARKVLSGRPATAAADEFANRADCSVGSHGAPRPPRQRAPMRSRGSLEQPVSRISCAGAEADRSYEYSFPLV